jgi:hypothetical protein
MRIKVLVLKILLIDPICGLINTARTISHYSLNGNFNIIFAHILNFSKWPCPFRFSKLKCQYLYFPVSIITTSLFNKYYHMLLAMIFLIMFVEECELWSSSLFSFLKSPVTSCLLRTNQSQTSSVYIHTFNISKLHIITRKTMCNFRLPPQST